MNRPLRLAALAWCLVLPLRAAVDFDADGLSDVWEALHHPAILEPGADIDHDGRSNLDESRAGTDPTLAGDFFACRQMEIQGSDLLIQWPTVAGKRYLIQSSTTLTPPAGWSDLPGTHTGTGNTLSATSPLPPSSACFFRIVAFDVDTDSDGVTDWEEILAGLDPANPHTHGHHGDLEHLTDMLQAPDTVSIAAGSRSVTEGASTAFTVTRAGGIKTLVVSLSTSGSATSSADFAPLPTTVTIPFRAAAAAVPLATTNDPIVESPESVILSAASGTGYLAAHPATAAVLIEDNPAATGTGLSGQYWDHPNNTRDAPYFTGKPGISRIDATVNFDSAVAIWPGPPVSTATSSEYFSSRWSGEILPEFSQIYTIYTTCDSAGRLWIGGKLVIDNWPPATLSTSEKSAIVTLEAGIRVPVVFEHYNNSGGHKAVLSWQSASQSKQVIPQARLFPGTPPRILGPFEAWAFVGDPTFSAQIAASGNPTSFAAENLPPDFAVNPATGQITGNPSVPGTWEVVISATNANGTGAAILVLTVIQTSGTITREVWHAVPGSLIEQIPLTTAPDATSSLSSLDAPSDQGDDYGARIRGFLTAPATGEYRFFLRADESARFLLSNDEEPVNSWTRAELTSPAAATGWSAAAQSPLLHLEAGRRYYLEILHKESTGADHLALAWSKPGEPDTTPSDIVPGHVLTRFEDLALGTSPDGTLFFAQLTPQSGVVTNGYGSCTLRLSADQMTAWVIPSYSNLGSAFTGMHVHDSRLPTTSNIVFDLDEPGVEQLADGSYVWHIQDTGGLTAQEIADGLGQYAFFNVHTANYPAGEIRGFFRRLDGSSTFTPPPPPPDWTSESAASNNNPAAASRFLQQATFGPSDTEIATLQAMPSFEEWLDTEFAKPATNHYPHVEQFRNVTDPNGPTYPGTLTFNSWWRNSIQADDQLRQRVAFALSEIMVVSESGPLDDRANALSDYYDTLLAHAFGNARDLLESFTLHPAMGRYLDMLRNDKPDLASGRIPNENYAREILQLFSVGLNRLHPDGSLILSSKGLPIPTYDQDAIIGLAHAFTSWDYNYTGSYRTSFGASTNWIEPMREVPARHFTGRKRLLNNVVLPGLPSVGGAPLDPYASHSAAAIADPAYQALPAQELDAVLDQIFQHPNTGPFLCRQLIQRLVTSTPSRGYIHRVVTKFNDNGSGVRGDLKAVIKAILLDYEARSINASNAPGFGKQREPVIRVTNLARAFRPAHNFAGAFSQDGGLITIDTAPAAHRLAALQKVLLAFTSGGVPATDADYSVVSVAGTTFTVRTKDVHRSTWSQTAATITVTTPSNHVFAAGQSVFVRFRSGAAAPLTDGVFPVLTAPSATTFTIAAPDSATRSGVCDVAWLAGSYSQTSAAGVTTLTITCATLPGLAPAAKLALDFTPVTGQTKVPEDGTYTIVSVSPTEPRRYTVTPDSGSLSTDNGLSGKILAAPLVPLIDRSGTALSGYSDWNISSTDTDLGQTPLGAPSVFNFFEPDYQFPGLLAANGLVTPEFQISSDTNVIRQANFLFGGIYSSTSSTDSSSYTNGFSSFRADAHDIMMDVSPWMGPRTTGTDYWTNNANLRELIRRCSRILMAGRMSQGMEDEIYDFVSNTSNIPYTAAAPTDRERRNRVRAILHLIAISPEHAVQQ